MPSVPLIQWFMGHLLVHYSPLGHSSQVLLSRDFLKATDMILGSSLQSLRNKIRVMNTRRERDGLLI